MNALKIDVRKAGPVCVMGIAGEIKRESTEMLRERSRSLVAAGERYFVLDMLDVPWLDSSGIGEIFACYKRARVHGGVVKLVLRDKAQSLFALTQLDRVFEIFEDPKDAIASFPPSDA